MRGLGLFGRSHSAAGPTVVDFVDVAAEQSVEAFVTVRLAVLFAVRALQIQRFRAVKANEMRRMVFLRLAGIRSQGRQDRTVNGLVTKGTDRRVAVFGFLKRREWVII